MHWYFDAWKQYAQFSGRASREAFWVFFLVNCLVSAAFIILEIFFQSSWLSWSWRAEAIYSLLAFLPMLSLTVRRLHDTNRSAWWLLVILVPAVGIVLLLALLALPSKTTQRNDDMNYPQNYEKH